MQTLTPELEAILKDQFQAGAQGYRARFEIDRSAPPAFTDLALLYGPIWYYRFEELAGNFVDSGPNGITLAALVGAPTRGLDSPMDEGGGVAIGTAPGDQIRLNYTSGPYLQETFFCWFETTTTGRVVFVQNRGNSPSDVGASLQVSIGPSAFGAAAGQVSVFFNLTSFWQGAHTSGTYNDGQRHFLCAVWQGSPGVSVTPSQFTLYIDGAQVALTNDSGNTGGGVLAPVSGIGFQWLLDQPDYPTTGALDRFDEAAWYDQALTLEQVELLWAAATGGYVPGAITTTSLRPQTVNIDKSLRLAADQADASFTNEDIPLGWGPSSLFLTNSRCRIFQWYGDEANAIRVFTGLVDIHHEHREVSTVDVALRDMFAILIDQTFSSVGPQEASEDGAIRTEANGVYLNREVSYIVTDLLDRVGWPVADRDITPTSYVLDEFLLGDGESYAAAILGETQLAGLVGYSAWADEMGIFHFAPTAIAQNLTQPVEPVYTYEAGVDLVALDDETDQYDLITRVKVRGPLTTQTLQDTWRELWRTRKFNRPVGLWHDPADPGNLRVLDRGTKRMYKLRQSDRVVLSSVNIGAVISHPLGLSGDPADPSIYWVLNAPWIYTGSTSGNSVKKVRKSDNHVLATYSIPNGRWSALKVSASFLWLTNLDTDRFYKRSKTDGSAIANYQHTYSSTTQANPSGMMIDGTTLYVFWSNGGTTARFLKCDESAPGTVTDVVKTAGTVLHGGEMDTVTHTECYGDSDSLGLVAKFTLLAAVDQTSEVYAEVVDSDLEDELGASAQLEQREHDTHPTDADHPYEVRRRTLDLTLITSLAQATETAQRQLELGAQRRRVLDAGIIGNPALQKTDPIAVWDPLSEIDQTFVIDTYRTSMAADGTYLGTVVLLPVAALDDDPTDEGDATE